MPAAMMNFPSLLLRYVSVRLVVLLLSSGASSVAPVQKVFAGEAAVGGSQEGITL